VERLPENRLASYRGRLEGKKKRAESKEVTEEDLKERKIEGEQRSYKGRLE
jgi:hypothetical protein